MMFAPLEGWRHVKVTDRHTAVDYARVLKDLADIHFAHAKTIVLVQDNLSIHSKASLYEAFPAVVRRIPNQQILIEEIAGWEHDRNANHTKADWQFTTKNARIKLKGTSKNRSYSSDATKLPANDSVSFPFRFINVRSETVSDRQRK